ncbi:hypothetical protein K431DRAFT_288087 [Polychaeton citri CBS 116435]|uniref:SUI1 domain-containing protein n=1 Tax=Polychaeton citri CBS 116435 TaxID=1314669 RepID=A0A9P4Q226_9PEZI|nr:hypothetical protein K431DRAFT_288087 [Polychaeton citri CBS 116435]
MFKKKPTIKPLAPLRSSDRRRLADQIIKDYNLNSSASNNETASPEEKAQATAQHTSLRNSLLPDNTQSARFTTTCGPDLKSVSGTVYVGQYNGQQRVLWWEVDKQLFPTVYSLWRNPDLVPLLHTPPIVVGKLQGGADLMTPGLAAGPPFPQGAKKGAVVGVAATNRPSVPVVVGVCEVDVAQLGTVAGARGKAVENLHWYEDELWDFAGGGSAKGGLEAPEEIEGWADVLSNRGLVEKMKGAEIEDDAAEGGVRLENGGGNLDEIVDRNEGANGRVEMDVADESETQKPLMTKEIDDAFRNAFLYGVTHHMNTNASASNFGLEFPLSQSFVMSNLIQPFLPTYTPEQAQQLQIKKTSYKNIKKFVKSLDKERILKSKEKDGHETVILDIDFEDRAFKDFKPYRLPRKETAKGGALGRGETGVEQADGGDSAIGQTLKVGIYYKPAARLQPIFDASSQAESARQQHLFTKPEIRPIVDFYLAAEDLISGTNKRLVRLNPTLANAVFDGSTVHDKEVLAKGAVSRDALVDRVIKAMTESYAILRNPQPSDPPPTKTKSGAPPKVKLSLETRSGNKTVTKVSGLEIYFINPKSLADELRKLCAGSTSVEPLAGGAKKNEKPVEEVMIQGPQQDAVVKALGKRGVDPRWIEFIDKTKGKGKGR